MWNHNHHIDSGNHFYVSLYIESLSVQLLQSLMQISVLNVMSTKTAVSMMLHLFRNLRRPLMFLSMCGNGVSFEEVRVSFYEEPLTSSLHALLPAFRTTSISITVSPTHSAASVTIYYCGGEKENATPCAMCRTYDL